MAKKSGKVPVYDLIDDLFDDPDGKNVAEIEALKNNIKILNLEHKVEIMEKEKEIQIKDKKIEIQAKEIQILKLENENKVLKLKDLAEDTTPLKNEKQTESIKAFISQKDAIEFYINTDDLLTKGIAKFFFGEQLNYSYHEWFEVMVARMTKNIPFIFEKSVMVRVKCRNPMQGYTFYSGRVINTYYDQFTELNILDKGWTHDTASVFILHPNLINKSIHMKESVKIIKNHGWYVASIPEDYIEKDGFFVVLCLKNKQEFFV